MSLILSSGPHIHSGASTRRIMADVVIALLPSLIAACILFSVRALLLAAVCVIAAVGAELLFCLLTKKPVSVGDGSAVVTGLILALVLPVTMPLWEAALGAVTATAFVKMLFGGIGQNFANPAATARVILLISFASDTGARTATRFMTDAVSAPTPLSSGDLTATAFTDYLLGNRGGAMGETCVIAILLGCAYLLWRRVISWETPAVFTATVFLFTWIATGDAYTACLSVMAGGLLFGAVFMATDYTTTPLTRPGKIIFAAGCGVITSVIRLYCGLPEGVSYAILLMNLVTPYIDKITMPKAFGGAKV